MAPLAGVLVAAEIACYVVPPAIHFLEHGWNQVLGQTRLEVIALAVDSGCIVINLPTGWAFAALDARIIFNDVRVLNPKPEVAHVYPRYMRGQGR